MNTFKIEPCFLLIDKIEVDRAVKYTKKNEQIQTSSDGSEHTTWEAERLYKSREEATKANTAYAAARAKLRSASVATDIGFICPVKKQQELIDAIAAAQKIVDDANSSFTYCHVKFRVVCTRIEPTNAEGVDMLRETIDLRAKELHEAIVNFDYRKARGVLNASKGFIDVLAEAEARDQLQQASLESKQLCSEISQLLKEFDGNTQNAMVSPKGKLILGRAKAPWNF